jgi:hypothetical protein
MLLLDLSDVSLSLRNADGVLYDQPGVALVQNNELLFGTQALAGSRLHPLDSNDSYLEKLSAEPLPRVMEPARNYADLVYRHLLALAPLADGAPVTVSVCPSTGADQLAVLLGIASEAGLQIRSFVNRAVLLAASHGCTGHLTVIDLHRHRLVLTHVSDGPQARYTGHEEVPGAGAQGLMDGWTSLVADQFIRATRFDPLHSADSEQQLHDAMESWRQAGDTDARELAVDIEQQGESRRALVATSGLLQKTSTRLAPANDHLDPGSAILLTPAAAAFPGVLAHFQQHSPDAAAAGSDALTRALVTSQAALDSERVQLKTALPRSARDTAASTASRPDDTPKTPAEPELQCPTHLLSEGLALPLHAAIRKLSLPLAVAADGACQVKAGEASLTGPDGQALAPGTALGSAQAFAWQGQRYQLITVEPG